MSKSLFYLSVTGESSIILKRESCSWIALLSWLLSTIVEFLSIVVNSSFLMSASYSELKILILCLSFAIGAFFPRFSFCLGPIQALHMMD